MSGAHKHVAKVWSVPSLAQTDATTCWEASAHMVYLWRHRSEKNPGAGYAAAAGPVAKSYLPKNLAELAGLCGNLKMTSAPASSVRSVESYLRQSPLVIWRQGEKISHIMVLVGYSDRNWYYINPQVYNKGPSTQHTFGAHSYDPKTGKQTENTVITPHSIKMNTKQASWRAALLHVPKATLFSHLGPKSGPTVFGYLSQGASTPHKMTEVKH